MIIEAIKPNYVWKKVGDDVVLVKSDEKDIDNEKKHLITLSRMNKNFPYTVYVRGKENKKLQGELPSDNLKEIKDYILKNIDKILGNKIQESKGFHNYKTQLEKAKTKDELIKVWNAFKKDYDSEMTPNEEKTLGELYKDLRKELKENTNNKINEDYNVKSPLDYIEEKLQDANIDYTIEQAMDDEPYDTWITINDGQDSLADEIICSVVGYAYDWVRDKFGNRKYCKVVTDEDTIHELNETLNEGAPYWVWKQRYEDKAKRDAEREASYSNEDKTIPTKNFTSKQKELLQGFVDGYESNTYGYNNFPMTKEELEQLFTKKLTRKQFDTLSRLIRSYNSSFNNDPYGKLSNSKDKFRSSMYTIYKLCKEILGEKVEKNTNESLDDAYPNGVKYAIVYRNLEDDSLIDAKVYDDYSKAIAVYSTEMAKGSDGYTYIDIEKVTPESSLWEESLKESEDNGLKSMVLNDTLERQSFISFAYEDQDGSTIATTSWEKTPRKAHSDYISTREFLGNKYDIKVLRQENRDDNKEFAYVMKITPKGNIKESKSSFDYFTDKGRNGIMIARKNNLYDYYDPYTGYYMFTVEQFMSEYDKIKKLVNDNSDYCLISELAKPYDVETKYDIVYFLVEEDELYDSEKLDINKEYSKYNKEENVNENLDIESQNLDYDEYSLRDELEELNLNELSKLVDDFSSAVSFQEQQAIIRQAKRLMKDKRISNDLRQGLNSYFNINREDESLKENNKEYSLQHPHYVEYENEGQFDNAFLTNYEYNQLKNRHWIKILVHKILNKETGVYESLIGDEK